ncbi:MAG: hypothetical protein J1E31_06110 [Helicobacter sp.]|nr:hypothetical protein [Helicobacter sp.]
MARVLIYGFGWCGQSAFALCNDLGFEVSVVDDGMDYGFTQDERFLTFEEMLQQTFDIYLVCSAKAELCAKLVEKLKQNKIQENKIKIISIYRYKKKMRYLLKDFFSEEMLTSWLKESINLPHFHTQMEALEQKYFQDKKISVQDRLEWRKQIESKLQEKTIFAKMYATSVVKKALLTHIAYPGFNVGSQLTHIAYPWFNVDSQEKPEDKNFYFIQKIDFEKIKNRSKDLKLVACLGNSAMRVEYLPISQSISGILQQRLGEKYVVLNFGVTGYTLYEQLMLYTALVHQLKPEIVISCFGGTDYRCGLIACESLVKTHHIVYTPWFYEQSYKNFSESELPLYLELGTNSITNPYISYDDINQALVSRLKQFYEYVLGGGEAFMALFSLYCLAKKNGVLRKK